MLSASYAALIKKKGAALAAYVYSKRRGGRGGVARVTRELGLFGGAVVGAVALESDRGVVVDVFDRVELGVFGDAGGFAVCFGGGSHEGGGHKFFAKLVGPNLFFRSFVKGVVVHNLGIFGFHGADT